MSDSDDTSGRGPLKPTKPLVLRRVETAGKPVAVRSLTLRKPGDITSGKPEAPPLFETVRVVDLARFRAGLVRSLSRNTDRSDSDRRSEFLKTLDRVRDMSPGGMPHVAVVKRSAAEGLVTNYSIVGNLIFIGAHLSKSWVQGKEDPAYHTALMDAVSTYLRRLESLSGTRTIRRPFYN